MHVIICGAGEVGHAVAQYLSQENSLDISVIDRVPELVEHLNQTLDVRGIVGDCCDPGILEKAGLENADVLLVLTGSNEVNMVCCQLADSFFSVNCKIARLKRGATFDRAWDKKITESFVKADTVLTFENMVAHAIADRLERQGVLDSETFLDKAVHFIGVRCTENCPLLSTPLKQLTNLFPNLSIRILALERDGQGKIPNASDFLLLGDTVWFVVKTEQIVRALEAFGIESEDRIHQVGIVGGGEVGSHLAFELLRRAREDEGSFTSGLNLTFIERDGARAQDLASQLEAQTILQGNVMDADTLGQLSPDKFYAWVSVTNQEETNILSSLMMKASGCSWVLALIAEPSHRRVLSNLGVDVLLSPREISLSGILPHIRRGRVLKARPLLWDFAELLEIELLKTSEILDTPLRHVKFPPGVLVGAIQRDTEIFLPRGDVALQAGDKIVVISKRSSLPKLEQLIVTRFGFF